jgi:virginiamycin B lyase
VSRFNFGRFAVAAGAVTACATLLAACDGHQNGGALPRAATSAGFLHGAADVRGTVTTYADTFGDPTPAGITGGPDGALWFTDPGNDVIGRITTAGTYTMQMSAGVELSGGITTGPDGNLWFTVGQQDAFIGRITTAGKVKLFKDPGGSFPQGITTGPDGALWFAESNGTVGRMTTKGSVKHFSVAPSNALLEGIVTGPDGRLWVTQFVVGGSRLSNQVIRVTTTGKSTSFTVGSGPESICVGPDRALWFTESAARALGRLTTGGAFTEFPIGDSSANASGIAAGPDGALWFTDGTGIGRMTVAGKLKHYTVTGGLAQINTGPDGAMWFTSSFGPPAIGRVTVH